MIGKKNLSQNLKEELEKIIDKCRKISPETFLYKNLKCSHLHKNDRILR